MLFLSSGEEEPIAIRNLGDCQQVKNLKNHKKEVSEFQHENKIPV